MDLWKRLTGQKQDDPKPKSGSTSGSTAESRARDRANQTQREVQRTFGGNYTPPSLGRSFQEEQSQYANHPRGQAPQSQYAGWGSFRQQAPTNPVIREPEPRPTSFAREAELYRDHPAGQAPQSQYAGKGAMAYAIPLQQELNRIAADGGWSNGLEPGEEHPMRTSTNTLTNDGAPVRTRELTWDEYNALSPQQRAAVDANTAIADAALLDKDAGTERAEGYDEAVNSLFGTSGGSDRYAPATLAVLEQLGLKDLRGNDLDNFLNLDSLVTMDDLKLLTPEGEAQLAGAPKGREPMRLENAFSLSRAATSTLAQTLAKGQTLLQATGLSQSAFDEETTGYLDQLWESMARKDNGYDRARADADIAGMRDELGLDNDAIYDYFNRRLSAATYGGALGSNPGATYMSADEIRNTYLTAGG